MNIVTLNKNLLSILVRIGIATMEHYGKKQAGKKKVIWLIPSHCSLSVNEVRTETQARLESGGRK